MTDHNSLVSDSQKQVFSDVELEQFAQKNQYTLPQTVVAMMQEGDFSKVHFECIDGRRGGVVENEESQIFTVEVPGGALGVLQDVLSTLSNSPELEKNAHTVSTTLLEILGGRFGFHTDDHSLHLELSCAGCGHCKGALVTPEPYLQLTVAVDYIVNTFLPYLKSINIAPTVYGGEHAEKGVIISNLLHVELNSIDPDTKEQVFTYNQAVHDLLLTKLVERLKVQGLDIDLNTLLKNKNERLGVTVNKLAKGLPVFVIA